MAHKTGSAFRDAQGVMVADNDIGIVRLPDGRSYSIAVFVTDSARTTGPTPPSSPGFRGSFTITPPGDNEMPLRRGLCIRYFSASTTCRIIAGMACSSCAV
ncbi:MAG: hypothetical protein ACLSH3_15795 [Alistipes finegoldii]